ncbi:uncharacterized protein K452DRAFT_42760 [Aplosporella prunicola CBS 121167]|uniref:N-alpha-acetyltransferase 40 n=1 Tax=Aplosporella prunicola CBS 121167 TaxID=1176127 RepID=A0A6A6BC17_9PEZI|nr:uncharacterized protein K452DRAFT_42760 [Aplosporella prunicola CBS 121167]KAF2140913.1 hypothetical protein K452DRAFT_42760 [Aplosporella prunicola CBS 121167]
MTEKCPKRRKKPQMHPEDIIDSANALSPESFANRFFPPTDALTRYKDYDITLKPVTHLDSDELEQCFRLIEHTSIDAYKASSRGWNPKDKRQEMKEENMQYLLVRRRPCAHPVSNGDKEEDTNDVKLSEGRDVGEAHIVAFLAFMLTIEDDYPVNYIYEIHMYGEERGRGLGQHLMHIAQRVAEEAEVAKVMLTVFTSNAAAMGFYRKLGFDEDEYSPPAKRLRGGKVKRPSYMIMSKSVD